MAVAADRDAIVSPIGRTTTSASPRPALPAVTRRETWAPARSASRVTKRFVLDELDPAVADRPLGPPVPEAAPQVGQQLGVPRIAAVHLDEQWPLVVGALEQHDSLRLHRRRREIVDADARGRRGRAGSGTRSGARPANRRRGGRSPRRSSPNAIAAAAPDGSAAPSMIVPTNWNGISQRPRLRNGRLRCGDAVEITAVAMTRRPGGNMGGPSTSNSRSVKPVPSSMTIAATAAASTSERHGARTRSRASARRPRTRAATMSTSDHATGAQNDNRHNVSKNAGHVGDDVGDRLLELGEEPRRDPRR